MTGGLIQLVSIGFENLYLTVDPEITFFKMVYKRYTNFSQEPIVQLFTTTPNFDTRVSCNISKNADLLRNINLYVEIPEIPKVNEIIKYKWIDNIGYGIIEYIELEINGNLIDKLYGDWLNIWNLLTISQHRDTIDKLIGNVNELKQYSNNKKSYKLYIPIEFYFNKNYGMALPLISLSLSDIKIHIKINKLKNVLISSPTHYITINEYSVIFKEGDIIYQEVNGKKIKVIFNNFDYKTRRLYYTKYNESLLSGYELYDDNGYNVFVNGIEKQYIIDKPNITINDAYLICNYIYLDNMERQKISTNNHEYLITNLQFSGDKFIYNSNTKIKLSFVNPCKEIFWIAQFDKIRNSNIKQIFNYTDDINSGSNIVISSRLLHNGQERTSFNDKTFYNYLMTYLYHNNTITEGLNIYSYSLEPENNQPQGSCNFSKIDDIVLDLTLSNKISYNNPVIIKVYSLNYNILKINNGLAGLIFSN